MEKLELEVSKREITGKKVRFLRRQGIVPANLYGHGIDSVPLQVDAKHLKEILAKAGKTDLVSLKVADSKTPKKIIVREVQRNPLTDEFLHVDLYHVKMTEKIKTDVPLAFVGEAPVLKSNKEASLLRLINSLPIEAMPDDLPHNFEVDLSGLEETSQAIYVKDIHIGDGITLLGDPEQMVVKITELRREAVIEAVGEVAEAPEAEATADSEK